MFAYKSYLSLFNFDFAMDFLFLRFVFAIYFFLRCSGLAQESGLNPKTVKLLLVLLFVSFWSWTDEKSRSCFFWRLYEFLCFNLIYGAPFLTWRVSNEFCSFCQNIWSYQFNGFCPYAIWKYLKPSLQFKLSKAKIILEFLEALNQFHVGWSRTLQM